MTEYAAEATTNRLLRRVDWRFLLPNPHPAKSICFADGLLAEAVALISGQMVARTEAGQTNCELSVAINPSQATLKSAWAALQAGGVCYTEWYRPWLGGPAGVRRRLAAAGFTDVTCYWPWPWPTRANPQFWLPLEAPNALHYFLTNRPAMQARHRQLLQQLVMRAWQVSVRTHTLMPICAIARKPAATHAAAPSAAGQGMLATVQAELPNQGDENTPAALSCLLLTGGFRSINKVVGLVFADQSCEPQLIVKVPRVAESIPALAQEVATLRAVHALQPGGIPGVPTVLFYRNEANRPVVGESVLTGVPLWTQLRPETYRTLALQATDWIAKLAASAPRQPASAWWERLIEPVLATFAADFGPIVAAEQMAQTRASLATLGELPLVCEHRDFSPWNVLLTPEGQLAVLDWESAQWQGLPVLDLWYFLTYLTFFRDNVMNSPGLLPAYQAMLDPTTVTGATVHDCMLRYADRIGLDPAVLPPLRLLVWLIHAHSEYKHFVADGGGQPTPAILRRSLFVRLWAEELRQAQGR